jgi:hypothetical protein
LALLGLGGFYFYSKWQLNEENWNKLNADYTELGTLAGQKPHPGGRDVDNIKTAKEQRDQLRGVVQKSQTFFQRIMPIPDVQKVTDQDFSAALSRTIDKLQRDATNASINLPQNYNFSFAAEKPKVSFIGSGLPPLAVQLGEVKTICDLLFQSKINSLDNVRRERVSPDDATGPQSDYLAEKSVTNEMGVLTPYELTFRCFSAELASVLSGFAASPNAMIVKSINVELAPAIQEAPEPAPAPVIPNFVPQPVQPQAPVPGSRSQSEGSAFARRYGLTPGKFPAPQQQPAYVPPPSKCP